MSRKTLLVVILLFCCSFGFPQNEIQIFYRKTTVDPITDFFSRSCDLRSATCVERGECAVGKTSNNKCANRAQVCCTNQNGAVVFPESNTRKPSIISTRKQTTRAPPPRTTTKSTTTTTEESNEQWFTPDCGTQQSIVSDMAGARDSNIGEFPWNVEIYSKIENDFGTVQNVFLCGGTLIDSFVVLTAGNCVISKNTSNLFVDAGVWNVEDVDEKRQMRQVETIIRHPSFQHTTRIYSLALLVLDDQVDYSPTVNRICLPEVDTDLSSSTCYFTGWGGTGENPSETIRSKMKVLEMTQISHKSCQSQIRRTRHTYVLHDNFQCAIEDGNNHVCPFDLGSPLICTVPGQSQQFYQAGIFVWNQYLTRSGNANCANSIGVVNLFTDLKKYKSWIDTEMEKLDRNIMLYSPQ